MDAKNAWLARLTYMVDLRAPKMKTDHAAVRVVMRLTVRDPQKQFRDSDGGPLRQSTQTALSIWMGLFKNSALRANNLPERRHGTDRHLFVYEGDVARCKVCH